MKIKSATRASLAILILLAASCTIEKRLFQPGYSIEWKKRIPKKDANETISKFSASKENADSVAHTSSSNHILSDRETQLQQTGEKLIPAPELTKSIPQPPAEKQESLISDRNENHEIDPVFSQKKAIDILENEDKKELEIFGTMSFGLYLCSLILAITSLTFMNPGYLLIIAGFMIILSLIFGIISVDRYRRDKSKYYRNFFGYFGLIASLVTIMLVMIFLTLLAGLSI